MEEEKTQVQDTKEKQEDPAAGLQQRLFGISFKELTLRKNLAPSCLSLAAMSPSSSFPSTPAGEDHQHTQLSTSEESPSLSRDKQRAGGLALTLLLDRKSGHLPATTKKKSLFFSFFLISALLVWECYLALLT